MLLALVIAVAPPSGAYVEIRNQGSHVDYARSINCAGGLTCTSDGGYATFSAGDGGAVAGGSSPQVQYNNSGALGGISDVTSDGTHTLRTPETTCPAAPASGSVETDFQPATGFPQVPTRVDSSWRVPVPAGFFRASAPILPVANGGLCAARCSYFDTWATNTFGANYGTVTSVQTEGSVSSAVGWDAGTLLGRQRRAGYTNSGTTFTWIGFHSTQFTSWLGNTPGAGGFLFWARMFYAAVNNKEWTFVGLAPTAGAFSVSQEPSTMTNVVYFGCDAVDTSLHICSNDGTGSATCSDLGANFPCETANAAYDFWLSAAPNSDGGIGGPLSYYIERLDSAHTAGGTISSDLPANYAQLAAHVSTNNADSGVITGVMPIGYCTWDCW